MSYKKNSPNSSETNIPYGKNKISKIKLKNKWETKKKQEIRLVIILIITIIALIVIINYTFSIYKKF